MYCTYLVMLHGLHGSVWHRAKILAIFAIGMFNKMWHLPTSYKVSTGSIGTCHDPGTTERNGVDLVGRVAVPHDQLPVLAGRHQVPGVRGPVHGVDLGQVTSQCPPSPHLDPPHRLQLLNSRLQRCVAFCLSIILKNVNVEHLINQ